MNQTHPSRRQILVSGTALLAGLPAWAAAGNALAELERRAGGRLGVSVLNTGNGQQLGHRQDERFGMCSTFKLPLAAVILREVDQGRLKLDQWVPFGKADMVSHAPVTSQHLAQGGMTVAALAEATQTTSDNPAANLLLKLIGGPAGMTAVLRSLGDGTTRLDRIEPAMNFVPTGELRDTTTPEAMSRTVASIMNTTAWLKPASQALLRRWMESTSTGAKRLRAGFPAAWPSGDKTGTATADGMPDKYNDVGMAWPPGRAPFVVSAFYESPVRSKTIRDEDQAVLAEVGRIAAAWITAAT